MSQVLQVFSLEKNSTCPINCKEEKFDNLKKLKFFLRYVMVQRCGQSAQLISQWRNYKAVSTKVDDGSRAHFVVA